MDAAAVFRAQHARGAFPGGQLVVRRGGKVVVDDAIGLASGFRDDEPKVEVTAATRFGVFSASKPFVAMAVAVLEERGGLDVEKPLSHFVPSWPNDRTVLDVLTHRSGIVLPKVVALVIVMPLLTVYTDITGILGGMVMARTKLDVGFDAFVDRLDEAIQLSSYWTGLAKAPVFAMIVALVGCYQGFQVTGSAESVGAQTTMSVVQAIFLVIVTDALFSIVFLWLDL